MAEKIIDPTQRFLGVRVHPTALIEPEVSIGPHSSVWDSVHIRSRAVLGHHCIVGEKSYIAYDVKIGDYVKINAYVYLPTGLIVEDRVMIAAGTIFVNDKYPRAYDYERQELAGSGPNEETLQTLIKEGASVGAGCTVLADLSIGRYALVGAGSVVTKSVPDHAIVVGNPARKIGWACRCGHRLVAKRSLFSCQKCKDRYVLKKGIMALDPKASGK